MTSILLRIRDALQAITGGIAAILVGLLTLANFIGIICRFVFNNPLEWTFEFSIICFSWVIFLGVGMAFKNSEHMSLTFIVSNLPSKLRYFWNQAIHLVCLIFLVIAFVEGIRVTAGTWEQPYNTIPINKGLFYLSLPVGALTGFFSIVLNILNLKKEA
jgi:TRAP-type C4-dicarboxylate transport system permease small subunit